MIDFTFHLKDFVWIKLSLEFWVFSTDYWGFLNSLVTRITDTPKNATSSRKQGYIFN